MKAFDVVERLRKNLRMRFYHFANARSRMTEGATLLRMTGSGAVAFGAGRMQSFFTIPQSASQTAPFTQRSLCFEILSLRRSAPLQNDRKGALLLRMTGR